MAALTTLATVGVGVLGLVGKGIGVISERNANKKQEKRVAAADAAAKTAARERSLLDAAREDTGADVLLGKSGQEAQATGAAGGGAATSRAGSAAKRVGGLGKRQAAGVGNAVTRSIGL